jgi:hypothetical protein
LLAISTEESDFLSMDLRCLKFVERNDFQINDSGYFSGIRTDVRKMNNWALIKA